MLNIVDAGGYLVMVVGQLANVMFTCGIPGPFFILSKKELTCPGPDQCILCVFIDFFFDINASFSGIWWF